MQIQEEIIFDPFTDNDLTEMIKLRLGEHISLVDEKAITFASRKIAKSKGDAREVLQIMGAAITNATNSLGSAKLSEKAVYSPVVKIAHVMKAIKGLGSNNSMVNIIDNLPKNAKVVLCIATALGQVSSAWKMICTSNLKKFCNEAFGNDIIQSWSQDQFHEVIEQLVDADLISYEKSDEVFDFLGDRCIKVGVQLEDVELAMNDTLLKEDNFYSKMVDFVSKSDINQERAQAVLI